MEIDDVVVHYEHLDQQLKGNAIDTVGTIPALGLNLRTELKQRGVTRDGQKDTQSKEDFFQREKSNMDKQQKDREDKHLLPQTFSS